MADGLDVTELVRRTVQANARLYKGWLDLSLEYFRGITEIFGGLPEAASMEDVESGARGGVVVLEGEQGTAGRGAFLVTNDLERKVSCELVASDFADPSGAKVGVKATFVPPKLELAPGEQRVVQVEIPVDGKLAAGVGYTGEITVKGMAGVAIPVVLRRQHGAEEQGEAAPPPREPDEVKPNARQASRGRAGARNAPGKRAPTRKGSARLEE